MSIHHAVLTRFPPLQACKRPGLAALLGAVTGGLGLAIYFKSLRDLFPAELAGALVMRRATLNRRAVAVGTAG